MVEKAKSVPAKASGIGNQESWSLKAAEAMAMPVAPPA